jgi:hypothetical protein
MCVGEYIEIMGGVDSIAFKQFEDLFVRGFFALQKHVDALCTIVQVKCVFYCISIQRVKLLFISCRCFMVLDERAQQMLCEHVLCSPEAMMMS